jgi:hypothetical protein
MMERVARSQIPASIKGPATPISSPNFERARSNSNRPAVGQRRGALIDNSAFATMARQFRCHRQTNGSGAHNKDFRSNV